MIHVVVKYQIGCFNASFFLLSNVIAPLIYSVPSNNQCWEILQVYNETPTPGKLKLKGRHLPLLTLDDES